MKNDLDFLRVYKTQQKTNAKNSDTAPKTAHVVGIAAVVALFAVADVSLVAYSRYLQKQVSIAQLRESDARAQPIAVPPEEPIQPPSDMLQTPPQSGLEEPLTFPADMPLEEFNVPQQLAPSEDDTQTADPAVPQGEIIEIPASGEIIEIPGSDAPLSSLAYPEHTVWRASMPYRTALNSDPFTDASLNEPVPINEEIPADGLPPAGDAILEDGFLPEGAIPEDGFLPEDEPPLEFEEPAPPSITYNDIEQLKPIYMSIRNYNETLEQLKQTLKTHPVFTRDLYACVNDNLLEGLVIDSYVYENGILNVNITSANTASIPLYVATLTDLQLFENVSYSGYDGGSLNGVGRYKFTVACTLKGGELQ